MQDLIEKLRAMLEPDAVVSGEALREYAAPDGQPCQAGALLKPASTSAIASILRLCHTEGQAIVTLGGGTGVVGATRASSSEILLSLERMHQIESIDGQSRTLTVQAGATLQAVQQAAAAEGLLMPLDLGARGSATIGGNIATNAGGNQVIRYGMMREQVLGLEVVLADGSVLSMMNRVLKNNTGYDLKQLFIGSEGTLGVITRAVLRLRPLMPANNTALVAAQSLAQVIALLTFIERELGGQMHAFEVMWNSFYRVACRGAHLGPPPIGDEHAFYILIESSGSGIATESDHFVMALDRARGEGLLDTAVLAGNERERSAFWAIRDNVNVMRELMPLAAFDISLPVTGIEEYLAHTGEQLHALLGELRWVVFGHLGDGNLHLMVRLNREEPELQRRVAEIVYAGLAPIGGSISAEHGIGLDKRDFLHHSRSVAEMTLMRTLKQALDPQGILNPGRIFSAARQPRA